LEDAFLHKLDAVTSDDVKRVCAKYLLAKRGTLIFYRPQKDAKPVAATLWQDQMEKAYAKGFEEGKHPSLRL